MKIHRIIPKILIISCIALAVYIGHSLYYFMNNIKKDQNVIIHNKIQENQEAQLKQLQKQEKTDEPKDQQLEMLWQQGYNEYNLHNYEKCINIENEVIEQNQNYYKAYTIKGIAQCFSKNYNEGIANLNKSLEINADYGYGHYAKALALELYGHYDEAIKEYNRALCIEKYVWSYYGIASIYGRRGDIENVVKYLQMAINMDKAAKECAKKEEDFNNVRKYKEFQDLINN